MVERDQPSRRAADGRLEELTKEVRSIRDMLISEPEASPLGRALLQRSVDNRAIVERYHNEFVAFVKEEFQPLDDWWNQSKGAWKFVLGLSTVVGIVGAFFGVLAFFGAGR